MALIAVGVFLSSLTDNQGLAAGLGIAVILLNYYSVSLSEYVSSTPVGALAALLEEVMEGRLPNHRAELMAELDRLAGRER